MPLNNEKDKERILSTINFWLDRLKKNVEWNSLVVETLVNDLASMKKLILNVKSYNSDSKINDNNEKLTISLEDIIEVIVINKIKEGNK